MPDVDYENNKCQVSHYTIDVCFDPEQLPCDLIIHSAKRIVNYFLFVLSYVYSFSGRKIYGIINACVGLMLVMRFQNADLHAIPSTFLLIQNNYRVL